MVVAAEGSSEDGMLLAARGQARQPDGLTGPPYNRMVVPMQVMPLQTPVIDRVLGALADGTRRDILRRAMSGEQGVGELASHYPMSFAAVQKHVAILEGAGLVTKHRTGRRKVVQTNIEGFAVARRLLDQYEELWRGRIDRITSLLDDTKEIDR
jgi:DNA-binding transcriptional ArsR family regulator